MGRRGLTGPAIVSSAMGKTLEALVAKGDRPIKPRVEPKAKPWDETPHSIRRQRRRTNEQTCILFVAFSDGIPSLALPRDGFAYALFPLGFIGLSPLATRERKKYLLHFSSVCCILDTT